MIGLLFFLFGVLATLGMCGMAAWSDFKGFRIPNIVSVVIVAAFAIAFAVLSVLDKRDVLFHPLMNHIGAMLLVLTVTGFLFAIKQLGAGDSKFASAIGLWLGLQGLIPFLFYMALCGGVIGVISLVLKKKKPFKNLPIGSWPAKAQDGFPSVPYGIAIAVGALAGFIFNGYLSPTHWQGLF